MTRLRGFYFLRRSAADAPASDWISFDEIERLLQKRKIDQSWLVRRGGDNEWVTIADLLQHSTRSDKGAENPPVASFPCIHCCAELSIRIQAGQTLHHCPACGAGYRAVQANGASPVFLVLPSDGRSGAGNSSPAQSRKNDLPSEVKGAFTVLELDETATFDAVRQAHREMIKSYHPDKVAHLGSDLQRLAEVKTKLINASLRILENYFSTRNAKRR